MIYDCLRDKIIATGLVIIGWLLLQAGLTSAQTLDELYQRAKKEGRVVLYAPLSSKTEEIVFPAFRKRFPGINIEHVDATSDKLVARAITEARGGKIFGDVFGGTQVYLQQLKEQNLLLDINLPEAAAYPAGMKGSYWVASDTEYFVAGWNTSRVKKGEEPKQFEDFADAKWNQRLAAQPRGSGQVQVQQRRQGHRTFQENRRQQPGVSSRSLAIDRAACRRPGGCLSHLLWSSFSAAHQAREPSADDVLRGRRSCRWHSDGVERFAPSQCGVTLGALADQ
jgi:hypothetical protein